MPSRYFQDPNGKVKVAENIAGGWTLRDATPDELGDIVPPNIGEGSAPLGERLTIKWLAGHADAARSYLSKIGYEVRPLPKHYGGGEFNFAIRKAGSSDPFVPVDPDGPDLADLLDIVADVGVGVASGVGAVGGAVVGGGLPGGIAGGAAGAAVGETIRQGIGSAVLGVENIDVGRIGREAALGGAAELASPVIRGAVAAAARGTRGLGRIALNVGGRVAGVQGRHLFPFEDMLYERAKIPGAVLEEFHEAARTFRRVFMQEVYPRAKNQELRLAHEVRLEASQNPANWLDIRPIFDRVLGFTLKESETETVERTTRQVVESTTEQAAERAGVRATERGFAGASEVTKRGTVTTRTEGESAFGPVERTYPFDKTVDIEEEFGEATRKTTQKVSGEERGFRRARTERTITRPKMVPRTPEAKDLIDLDRSVPRMAEQLLEIMRSKLAFYGVENAAAVPPTVAFDIQQVFRKNLANMRAFGTQSLSAKAFVPELRDIFHGTKSIVERGVDASGIVRDVIRSNGAVTMPYSSLMRRGSKKLMRKNTVLKWIGAGPVDDPEALKKTEEFIGGMFGKGRGTEIDAVRWLEGMFDLPAGTLERPIRRAAIGAGIRSRAGAGVPAILPPLTAGGTFRGPSIIGAPNVLAGGAIGGGGVLGFMASGPVGALAGSIAGGLLASPKLILKATRAGVKVEPFVEAAERAGAALATNKIAHTAAVAALQRAGAAFAPTVAEDSKPATKRRTTVFGGI